MLRISIDYKVAIEESYDLRAYALVIRRKCFCRGAFCHADFDRPVYCICIKCMLRDIDVYKRQVYNRLKAEGLKARLILQVHDELICECPENEAQTVADILREEMSGAARLSVPLTVDAKIGHSWAEAH